jgi:hypothetical protein
MLRLPFGHSKKGGYCVLLLESADRHAIGDRHLRGNDARPPRERGTSFASLARAGGECHEAKGKERPLGTAALEGRTGEDLGS